MAVGVLRALPRGSPRFGGGWGPAIPLLCSRVRISGAGFRGADDGRRGAIGSLTIAAIPARAERRAHPTLPALCGAAPRPGGGAERTRTGGTRRPRGHRPVGLPHLLPTRRRRA